MMNWLSRARYVLRVAAREWRATSDAELNKPPLQERIAPNGYVYKAPKETGK